MKPTRSLLALAAALTLLTAPAFAQHKHAHAPATPGAAAEMADGEVRRVDAAKGVLLLRHGEIRSLNMGPMTMSFTLKDPAMAAGLKAGDKVRFAAVLQGETLLITQIQKVK